MAIGKRGTRRTVWLGSNASLNGVCIVAKGSLWTPDLCKYLHGIGIANVHLVSKDGYGRILESETVQIGQTREGEIYWRSLG